MTFNIERSQAAAALKFVFGTVTLDSSYPTNGEPVTPADFGLERLWDLHIQARGYVAVWDGAGATTSKVLLYRQTAATSALIEVPNATDLSTVVGRFTAIGTG